MKVKVISILEDLVSRDWSKEAIADDCSQIKISIQSFSEVYC